MSKSTGLSLSMFSLPPDTRHPGNTAHVVIHGGGGGNSSASNAGGGGGGGGGSTSVYGGLVSYWTGGALPAPRGRTSCSYCRTILEPARLTCRVCGAPVREEP